MNDIFEFGTGMLPCLIVYIKHLVVLSSINFNTILTLSGSSEGKFNLNIASINETKPVYNMGTLNDYFAAFSYLFDYQSRRFYQYKQNA